MHRAHFRVIELAAVSASTRGLTMGFAETEMGLTLYPGLHED